MVLPKVKRAVGAARNYVREVGGNSLVRSLSVEEVELDQKKHQWRIVVSFFEPPPKVPGHVLKYPMTIARERRLLLVDEFSNQVVSMKRVPPPTE